MTVTTYLFFNGCCEEAIEHYKSILGAEVSFLMRFKEGPAEMMASGGGEKIFHASLRFGETALDMSDVNDPAMAGFNGFGLLIHYDDVADAERVFNALAVGGEVKVPLCETFWARRYGIAKDRFGVSWKVQVSN